MKKIFKKNLESKLEQRKNNKVVTVDLTDIEILDYSIGSYLFNKIEKLIDENSDNFTDFEIIENVKNGHTEMWIIFKP